MKCGVEGCEEEMMMGEWKKHITTHEFFCPGECGKKLPVGLMATHKLECPVLLYKEILETKQTHLHVFQGVERACNECDLLLHSLQSPISSSSSQPSPSAPPQPPSSEDN